jgi:hypothetical protein
MIITHDTKNPLSFALVRVFTVETNREVTHSVCDAYGRYYILVPKGNYYIKVQKKNYDESYVDVFTSRNIYARRGIINEKFLV